ncbi:MAG: ABC transporter ATP-binding protein, partial [Clostridia bacterium]|nr:ABC transporter ATP-binding protein [Clostridia bacterium]
MKKTRQKAERGTVRKVLRCLRPYRASAAVSILLSAVSVALSLYVPVLIGRAVDCIVAKGQVDLAAVVSIRWRIGAVVAAGALLQWLIGILNNRISFHVVRDVRDKAFRKLQILPLRYLDAHPVGETVSRVIADADQFADGLLLGFSQLFTGAATIAGTLGFMLALRPAIAAVVVVLTPMSFVAAKFIATHTYRYFHDQSAIRAEQTALIDEVLTNQKVVQAFGREKAAADRFDEVNGRLGTSALKAVFFSSLTNPTTRFVNNVVYALVALCGALVCIASAGTAAPFTVGSLSAFLAYANQYTKPFNEISGVVTELQNALACAARLFELIDEEPQTPDDADAAVLSDVRGNVELRDVAFSYVPDRKLIEDLNLSVRAGQRVAIVGPTGCGKTTIINLLMRFYDVDAGEIDVEGRDVRHVTRRSLRASYGMVLQETWLKKGTIRENIAMGRPDASEEAVVAAAKA